MSRAAIVGAGSGFKRALPVFDSATKLSDGFCFSPGIPSRLESTRLCKGLVEVKGITVGATSEVSQRFFFRLFKPCGTSSR